jgi:hypothetical protein
MWGQVSLGEQKTLTPGSLMKLEPETVPHGGISVAVRHVAVTGD